MCVLFIDAGYSGGLMKIVPITNKRAEKRLQAELTSMARSMETYLEIHQDVQQAIAEIMYRYQQIMLALSLELTHEQLMELMYPSGSQLEFQFL